MTTEYEFISTGGCARCDAMAGAYSAEPERPHPRCQCEIVPTAGLDGPRDFDRLGHSWIFLHESVDDVAPEDRDGDGFSEVHTVRGTLYVICCDGSVHDEEMTLELILDEQHDSWEDVEDQLMEMEVKAEQRAIEIMRDCQPCEAQLVS